MRPKKLADWSCKAPILAPAARTLNSPVLCPQTAQHLHLSGLPGANTEAAPNLSAPSWPTLQCISMVTRHAPGDQGKPEIPSPQDETLSEIPAPRCLYYFCTCTIITQPTNAPKKMLETALTIYFLHMSSPHSATAWALSRQGRMCPACPHSGPKKGSSHCHSSSCNQPFS